MSKKKLEPLIPPDTEQCQAEHTAPTNFMTLGGPPVGTMVRCKNKPTHLLKENKPDEDGRRGSMTLCDECLAVFKKEFPASFATITPLKKKRKT